MIWLQKMTIGLLSMALLPGLAVAQPVALEEIPKFPAGTELFEHEAKFGIRGRVGGFAMPPSKYAVYSDPLNHREGSSEGILFRYRKTEDPAFTGGYILLMGDISGYQTLSFWIKGKKGGETFELALNDTISNKREDAVVIGSIYRYLPQGVTTEWQQVLVPLDDFFGPDMARVYSLVFQFNEEGEGIFWIDGLKFHEESLVDRNLEILDSGELVLDDFDHSSLNLLGRKANAYKRLPSVCLYSRVEEPRRGDQGRSLKLSYHKEATGWCGYYTLLNQVDGDYYDLSPYREARFWVRGEKGGESFEIGMADKSWLTIGDSVKAGAVDKYLPDGVSTEWQEVIIPLEDFGKLDWTQMGSFVFNFHQSGDSAVFIDDLKFVRKTKEDRLKEWEDW